METLQSLFLLLVFELFELVHLFIFVLSVFLLFAFGAFGRLFSIAWSLFGVDDFGDGVFDLGDVGCIGRYVEVGACFCNLDYLFHIGGLCLKELPIGPDSVGLVELVDESFYAFWVVDLAGIVELKGFDYACIVEGFESFFDGFEGESDLDDTGHSGDCKNID